MLLRCLTFSSGKSIDTDIPKPPYIEVNSILELEKKLDYYLSNREIMKETISSQYDWAKKYTNKEMVINRLLNF
jgi:hypothetical protein